MVIGLDIFREYFEQYPDNYVIIGGAACDVIINEAGFTPRATKDIDVILIVEVLNADFVIRFWEFIQKGNYEHREKSADDRNYFRFIKPENKSFPIQIELFSRIPDLIISDPNAHLTPIPVDDDLSSLSAILLSDNYYDYLIQHSNLENGLHHSNKEALICLKAKAFLEIAERIANGSKEDTKQLRKHKTDIFRLAFLLTPDDKFELPESIKSDMQAFVEIIKTDLPDKAIFKAMGVGNISVEKVCQQLISSFDLVSP